MSIDLSTALFQSSQKPIAIEQLPQQQLQTFVMALWCIWKRSNEKLWSDIDTSHCMYVHMACKTLLQWLQLGNSIIYVWSKKKTYIKARITWFLALPQSHKAEAK